MRYLHNYRRKSQFYKASFIRIDRQFLYHLIFYFNALQIFHKGNQIAYFIVISLKFRHDTAVFKILAEACQFQSFGKLADLQPKSDLLHTSRKNHSVSADVIMLKIRNIRPLHLINDIIISDFYKLRFQTQRQHLNKFWISHSRRLSAAILIYKKAPNPIGFGVNVVAGTGFEPTTFGL